jgi:hypothetical protein
MKKFILLLVLSMALFSCSNNESKMKSAIIDYLNKNARDPKSYEFVELKIVDTVTVGDYAENKILELQISNSEAQQQINITKLKAKDNPSETKNKIILLSEEIIVKNKKDSIELSKNLNNKEVIGFVATHKFRIKNGFGALDLSEMYVEFDKEFKLLEMDKDLNYSVFGKKL